MDREVKRMLMLSMTHDGLAQMALLQADKIAEKDAEIAHLKERLAALSGIEVTQ